MNDRMKSLIAASALVSCVTLVGTAHAGDITINTAGIYDPATITAAGVVGSAGNPVSDYAGAVEFGVTNNGVVQTLYAFCVDLTHDIPVSFDQAAGHDIVSANGDANSQVFNYAYHTSVLANDSTGSTSGTGSALTSDQIGQIGGLAAMGRNLIVTADPTSAGFSSQHLSDELAAVQTAIWQIEYPTTTFGESGDVATLTSQYVAGAAAGAVRGPVNTIYSNNGSMQGFVVGASHAAGQGFIGNQGAVPEPATWGLMIAGFGLSGMVLRRRRQQLAFAV